MLKINTFLSGISFIFSFISCFITVGFGIKKKKKYFFYLIPFFLLFIFSLIMLYFFATFNFLVDGTKI